MQGSIRLEHRLISVDHDQGLHVMLQIAMPDMVGEGRPPIALALVVDGPQVPVRSRQPRMRPETSLSTLFWLSFQS